MSVHRMPVLFISHGSPEIAVQETQAHAFLKTLARDLPRPKAILVVSAHWETDAPVVATGLAPETIYDFGSRFDKRLWDITYDAPGAIDTARRARTLIEQATGLNVAEDTERGRDHGVWTPLHLAYPDRDIPVTQLSIQPLLSPALHHEFCAALAPLRDEGVLIIGSGAITHNLSEFRGRAINGAEPDWVRAFRDWMHARIPSGDSPAGLDALLDYRTNAPSAVRNHPEDEHILPIFAALGASNTTDMAERIHASGEYGIIGMDVYRWRAG